MISIVMTYYDRHPQLRATLSSFSKYNRDDFEVIIIDDGTPEERDLFCGFNYNMRSIRVLPGQKTWKNPCIAFNKGFRAARGDIVIIQNAECLHFGDILTAVRENVVPSNYLVFSAYAIDGPTSSKIQDHAFVSDSVINKYIRPLHKRKGSKSRNGWYTHPTVRPRPYHFVSAMTKANLDELGGFDERYANGYCFDDDEFLTRIKRMRLDIKIFPPTVAFGVHQSHGYSIAGKMQTLPEFAINKRLYHEVTLKEKGWKVNEE